MRGVIGKVRRFYRARPLDLLALIFCFALAGYAALQVSGYPSFGAMLIWFGAAVVAHDLLLFPLYALADRSLSAALHRRHRSSPLRVPVRNYVRVPAMAAGLTFLLFFPGVLRLGAPTYLAATGLTQEPFAQRWLLLTAAFFAASAVLYALRLGRASPWLRDAEP